MMDDDRIRHQCCPGCGNFISRDGTGHRVDCKTLIPKFKLEITLGNDAMRTPYDLAIALNKAAIDINKIGELGGTINDVRERVIIDANGNPVGHWKRTGKECI